MSSPHGNLFWDANLNIITQQILTNSSCSTPNCSVSNKKRNVKVGREHDIHILHSVLRLFVDSIVYLRPPAAAAPNLLL